jgi:hypothetical protein
MKHVKRPFYRTAFTNVMRKTGRRLLALGRRRCPFRFQEREGVGYAAIIIAKIRSGYEVFVWFQPFGCQLVSNLDIK